MGELVDILRRELGITPPASDNGAHPLTPYLVDWHDLFADDDDEQDDWLLEPVIARARGHAWFAAAGQGKSYVALAAATALAAGRPWLGRHHPPAKVLYLDNEMTRADVRDRLEEFGYTADDLGNLHYALLPTIPGLDTPAGGQVVVAEAIRLDAELVVIDTTSRLFELAQGENDAASFQAFSRHCGTPLKQAGIAWLRIDHAGKDADKGQRGSSAKNDDPDIVAKIVRTDGGVKLVAEGSGTKRRIQWYPSETVINVVDNSDGTVSFRGADTAWSPGVADLAAAMDALDIPLEWGEKRAARALREQGRTCKTQTCREAIHYRRAQQGRTPSDLLGRSRGAGGAAEFVQVRPSSSPYRGEEGRSTTPLPPADDPDDDETEF